MGALTFRVDVFDPPGANAFGFVSITAIGGCGACAETLSGVLCVCCGARARVCVAFLRQLMYACVCISCARACV